MGAIGEATATGAIGAGMGMIVGAYNDARQVSQNRKLIKQQVRAQKELGVFNREQAMKMWEDTNYARQRQEMEKAGLNIGLMYGSAGSGGTTQGAGAGSVSSGTAAGHTGEIGMGMQSGIQLQLLKAQKENIEANTNKTNIEAGKVGGVDTANVEATTKNILQQTANAETQKAILEYDKTIREIDATKASRTLEANIALIDEALKKLKGEATSAEAKGKTDTANAPAVIKAATLANEATKAGISATKAGEKQTEATTANLIQDGIFKKWENELIKMGITSSDHPALRHIAMRAEKDGITLEQVMQSEKTVINKIKDWIKENTPKSPNKGNEKWEW